MIDAKTVIEAKKQRMDRKIDPHELGFDFDGVVADTADAFLRLACEEYGHCSFSLDDITSFEVEDCLRIDRATVQEIFTRILVDSLGTGLKPMPGAVEVLTELTRRAPVAIITARPLSKPVHAWLQAMLPAAAADRIRLTAMGDHDGKADHVRQAGLRYFIDDRPETCEQLDQAGIIPLVYSQPWNRDRHNFKSVSCWQDIGNLCL